MHTKLEKSVFLYSRASGRIQFTPHLVQTLPTPGHLYPLTATSVPCVPKKLGHRFIMENGLISSLVNLGQGGMGRSLVLCPQLCTYRNLGSVISVTVRWANWDQGGLGSGVLHPCSVTETGLIQIQTDNMEPSSFQI